MATREEGDEQKAHTHVLRSLKHDVSTYVTFVNDTDRTVFLFWFGYDGKVVNYGKIKPRHKLRMNTFVTHPWKVKDSVTSFTLLMNGQAIFYPREQNDHGVPFDDIYRDLITIHIPVFTLLQRCVEVVYYSFGKEKLQSLALPSELKQTLTNLTGPSFDRTCENLLCNDFGEVDTDDEYSVEEGDYNSEEEEAEMDQ